MPHPQTLPLKRALGLSTVLHLLLAPFLIASTTFALGQAVAREAGERETTRVSYLRLEVRAPARSRPVRARALLAAVQTVRPAPRALRAVRPPTMLAGRAPSTPAVVAKRPDADTNRGHTRLYTMQRATVRAPQAVGAEAEPQALVQRADASPAEPASLNRTDPDPVVETPAPPVVTPQPAKVVETTAHGLEVPAGGWGQSFDKPLVADEAALADLRTHYHTASAITVEVDEAGHATRVSLPAGLPDDVRAELERRLRELRYVPAECNGLRCGGTLQVLI